MKTRKIRTSSSTLSPATFLEAARRIGEGEQRYACCALDRASPTQPSRDDYPADSPESLWFNAVLKPEYAENCLPWYSAWANRDSSIPCEDGTTARIIGLCLCAELLKDGFDPYAKGDDQ